MTVLIMYFEVAIDKAVQPDFNGSGSRKRFVGAELSLLVVMLAPRLEPDCLRAQSYGDLVVVG